MPRLEFYVMIKGSIVKPKVTNDTCITVSYLQPTLLHWYFYLTNHCNTSDTMLGEYLKNNIKETGRPRT